MLKEWILKTNDVFVSIVIFALSLVISKHDYVDLSPRIRRASWISFGMIVTRFA